MHKKECGPTACRPLLCFPSFPSLQEQRQVRSTSQNVWGGWHALSLRRFARRSKTQGVPANKLESSACYEGSIRIRYPGSAGPSVVGASPDEIAFNSKLSSFKSGLGLGS